MEFFDKGIKLIEISVDRAASGAAVVDSGMGQTDVDEVDLTFAEGVFRDQGTGIITGDHLGSGEIFERGILIAAEHHLENERDLAAGFPSGIDDVRLAGKFAEVLGAEQSCHRSCRSGFGSDSPIEDHQDNAAVFDIVFSGFDIFSPLFESDRFVETVEKHHRRIVIESNIFADDFTEPEPAFEA